MEVHTDIKYERDRIKQDFVNEIGDSRCVCPTCGRTAKVYKYPINQRSVYFLRLCRSMHDKYDREWLRLIDIFNEHAEALRRDSKELPRTLSDGNFTYLRFWGLIAEREPHKLKHERQDGWKITQKGKDFLDNKITVPKHARIYANECWGFEKRQVSILEVVKETLNVQEIIYG